MQRKEDYHLNNNMKLAIILLSAASIGLVGCAKESSILDAVNSSQNNNNSSILATVPSETGQISNVSYSTKEDNSRIDVSNIHSLKIQSTAAKVTVIGDKHIKQAEWELSKGKSDGIEVNVTTSIEDGTLDIHLKQKKKRVINTGPLPSLTVRLPYKDFKSLEIHNDFGSISVESGLMPQHLTVSSNAGDITVTDVIGKESSNITTAFGNVIFNLPNQSEPVSVNLSTKMGSIDNQVALEKATNTAMFVSNELQGYVGAAQSDCASLNISTEVGDIQFKK